MSVIHKIKSHLIEVLCTCISAGTVHQSAKIGFIGLGNMGAHMARNLIKGGNEVVVFDVVPENVKSVTEAGQSV